MANAYTILGVSQNATQDEIKKAYKEKVSLMHPDRPGGNEKSFKRVMLAWSYLGTVESREKYDIRLRQIATGNAYNVSHVSIEDARQRAKQSGDAVISLAEALGFADAETVTHAKEVQKASVEFAEQTIKFFNTFQR